MREKGEEIEWKLREKLGGKWEKIKETLWENEGEIDGKLRGN